MVDIQYSTVVGGCEEADGACFDRDLFNIFAAVLDENTAGRIDGVITEDQLSRFVGTDGSVSDQEIRAEIRAFVDRHPSVAIRPPGSGNLEIYLAEKYPDVYKRVFRKEFHPPREGDVDGIKAVLRDNILQLARLKKAGSRGQGGTYSPWDFFVEPYLNGYGLVKDFNAILRMKVGGEENVKIAQDILHRAQAPQITGLEGCNDRNLRPCHAAVAKGLRGLARAIDAVQVVEEHSTRQVEASEVGSDEINNSDAYAILCRDGLIDCSDTSINCQDAAVRSAPETGIYCYLEAELEAMRIMRDSLGGQ